jgi:hypothetical protein
MIHCFAPMQKFSYRESPHTACAGATEDENGDSLNKGSGQARPTGGCLYSNLGGTPQKAIRIALEPV